MADETRNEAEQPDRKTERKQYVLQLIMDAETFQMTLGGTPIPICLGQMMVDEAGRILATMRVAADAKIEEQQRARAAQNASRTRQVLGRIKQ